MLLTGLVMVHLSVTGLVRSFLYMKNNFIRTKKLLSVKAVNKLLSCIDYYGLNVVKIGVNQEYRSIKEYLLTHENLSLKKNIFFNLKESKLEITTCYYKDMKNCTYIFDLNLNNEESNLKGQRAFSILQKYYKVPNVRTYKIKNFEEKWFNRESGKYVCSAKPIVNYNIHYDRQELRDIYEYDLNSAYASILMHKIPDLYNPVIANYPEMIKVNKDEVGFVFNESLDLVKPGQLADIKFKLIDSPVGLKNFCKKYYDLKSHSSAKIDRNNAKLMMNAAIGYCQRFNPFLRAYIVNSCNEVIANLLSKDSVCWNTDALFSRIKLNLNLGKDIGQWKEIKCATFRMIGNTYQINDELPTHRGVVKEYYRRFMKEHNRPFNLLTDKLENKKCKYSFNFNTMKLENNYEEIN